MRRGAQDVLRSPCVQDMHHVVCFTTRIDAAAAAYALTSTARLNPQQFLEARNCGLAAMHPVQTQPRDIPSAVRSRQDFVVCNLTRAATRVYYQRTLFICLKSSPDDPDTTGTAGIATAEAHDMLDGPSCPDPD